MDRRDYGQDKGSVRRARERVGASLDHIRTEPSADQSWLRSPDPATDAPPRRSPSQESAQWPLGAHYQTAQDILQHPLMSQPQGQVSQSRSNPRSQSNGELLTSFKFPNLPQQKPQPKQPQPTVSSRKSRDMVPPPSARRPGAPYQYENPKAHVSPIVEEAPDPSLRSRSMLSRASSGVLANLSTPNLAPIDQSEYDDSSRASTPPLPHHEPQIIRQASMGKKAKPAITNIRGYAPSEQQPQPQPASPQQHQYPYPTYNPNIPPSRQAALSALSAAVATGIGGHHHDVPDIHSPTGDGPRSTTPGGTMRMPFADSNSPPLSPRSVETARGPGHDQQQYSENGAYGTASTKSKSPLLTPEAERSRNPSQFQTARPGLSEKIPSSRRPPPLDFEQAPMERSSTTSLADLIKRATKLAANLDRGKTASRLGMLDMFYGDGEKPKRRGPNEKRESGISDMLGAFPGTPMGGLGSEKGAWPEDGVKMSRLPSRQAHRGDQKKRGRRCCGMSLAMFILVLVVLVILISAAVLVPVFLILVPRMNKNSSASSAPSLASCQKTFNCANSGQAVVAGGACSCACVSGHTGNHCEASQATNCTTATVGGIHDATMGVSIVDLLQNSENNFSVPLDSSTILGVFAANDLSCMDEESLVDFNFQTAQKRSLQEKRFYPIHEMDLDQLDLDHFMPVDVAKRGPQPTAKPELAFKDMAIRAAFPAPAPTTVATSNGVVFQAPSSTADVQTMAAPASATSSASSSTATASVPEKKVNFARVVVLYVLEQSNTLSVAVNAHLLLQNYLASGGDGSVEVGFGALDLRADFGPSGPRILWGNGTIVGL